MPFKVVLGIISAPRLKIARLSASPPAAAPASLDAHALDRLAVVPGALEAVALRPGDALVLFLAAAVPPDRDAVGRHADADHAAAVFVLQGELHGFLGWLGFRPRHLAHL